MMEYEAAVRYIEEIPKFTSKHDHTHTKLFLSAMGISMEEIDKLKIIHVAGTNGKGSVCAFMASILAKAGKYVGVFTSPHLVRHNERIRIGQCLISDEAFCAAFQKGKVAAEYLKEQGEGHPSYFEFLFGMGMYAFLKAGVEYVILETGLGGRLDATNLVPHPVLTIITSIGRDHMEYLGESIQEIAGEKAGIIKSGVPVVYWGEHPIVTKVIETKAKEMGSPVQRVSKKDYKISKKNRKGVDFYPLCGYYLRSNFTIPFMADYQVENAMLAIRGLELLESDRKPDREMLAVALRETSWEGRMEEVAEGVIFDGAHNAPGITAFIEAVRSYPCKGKKGLLFSVVNDKEYEDMVRQLCYAGLDRIYIAKLDSERGLQEEVIGRDFENYGFQGPCVIASGVKTAFRRAWMEKREEDVLFCAGSLYLIGELKELLLSGDFEKELTGST